jgi:hypothetical protein
VRTIAITFERTVPIRKAEAKKQVVLGVVYEPNVRDTDGNFMTADEIEKMAYNFMESSRLTRIDKNHDGKANKGVVVESLIARKGDPDFPEGAWAIGVHVTDGDTWKAIEKGDVTGFSIYGRATLVPDKGEEASA